MIYHVGPAVEHRPVNSLEIPLHCGLAAFPVSDLPLGHHQPSLHHAPASWSLVPPPVSPAPVEQSLAHSHVGLLSPPSHQSGARRHSSPAHYLQQHDDD